MDLKRAQRQVAGHLSDWRTPSTVAHQLGEHDHILREYALSHSLFENREYWIASLSTGVLALA